MCKAGQMRCWTQLSEGQAMPDESGYMMTTLRYYPDLVRQEFVNVGVAVVCPQSGWWNVRVATHGKLKSLTALFPSAQVNALKTTLDGIAVSVAEARRFGP